MTFYFGGGYKSDSDPGTAFVEGYKKSRLGKLLGDAYSAPKEQRSGLLGQIAQIDPQAAQGADERFAKLDERAAKQLQEYARLTHAAWKSGNKPMAEGIYGQAVQLAKQVYPGFEAGPLDDSVADMFGQLGGVSAEQEEYTLTPGSARFRGGKQIASVPYQDKPQAATFQKDADGNGWWLRPGEAPIPADSPAAAGLEDPGYGAAQFDPQAFVASVGSAISPLGGRITSTTGGQHNPGSKHYSGGAVDVGMGRETPEQQARILQALQAQGLNVRDERTRPQGQKVWGGPHLHVEPGQQARRINFGKAEQPKFQSRRYTAQEVAEIGLPPGTVAYTSEDGTPKIVNKPDAAASGQKPMPVRAMTEDLEIQAALDANAKAASVLKKHAARMAKGELAISPGAVYGGKVREFVGAANPNDVNITELRADMTAIVNESLRLNKGVQTEGDAQRAYKEIMTSNDPSVVARAVQRLSQFAQEAAKFQSRRRNLLYSNYGRGQQPSQPREQPKSGPLRYNPATGDFD